MAKLHMPFRYDYVGSFLRPEALKRARLDFEKGKIDLNQLTKVENQYITDLIKKQKLAGYSVITDGEFRRSYWHLDFMWGLEGIEKIELDHGYFFHGEETTPGSIRVVGKIGGKCHPFVEHFRFVKQFEDEHTVAKQTIPAPAQLYAELFRDENGKQTALIYKDKETLIQDIAKAYQQVIQDLYDAGCRNLQLDDCTWGMFCDKGYQDLLKSKNRLIQEEMETYLYLNNLAIENHPEDLVITTHVCRGNYHSTWASSGGYEMVAPLLFARENVDGFYLEFDDERSGGFEPLRFVALGKKVVLGLITSKSPVLEKEEDIIKRVHEASQYIPLENLYLSPQCGFASCEIGNKLSEKQQWDKLNLVKNIAFKIW